MERETFWWCSLWKQSPVFRSQGVSNKLSLCTPRTNLHERCRDDADHPEQKGLALNRDEEIFRSAFFLHQERGNPPDRAPIPLGAAIGVPEGAEVVGALHERRRLAHCPHVEGVGLPIRREPTLRGTPAAAHPPLLVAAEWVRRVPAEDAVVIALAEGGAHGIEAAWGKRDRPHHDVPWKVHVCLPLDILEVLQGWVPWSIDVAALPVGVDACVGPAFPGAETGGARRRGGSRFKRMPPVSSATDQGLPLRAFAVFLAFDPLA